MKVYLSSSFRKKIKKFTKIQKLELDNEIRGIIQNPSIGNEKKGDLRGVFILKFKIQKILYLLSYRRLGEDIELIMIGPHENYYRDQKLYLNKR